MPERCGLACPLARRGAADCRPGRRLASPTANPDVPGLERPPHGVYAARVLVRREIVPAVLNLGIRPTLGHAEGELRFEVHLLDFQGDLYGSELEVGFVAKLRDERKFPGIDALKTQIGLDVAAARAILTA